MPPRVGRKNGELLRGICADLWSIGDTLGSSGRAPVSGAEIVPIDVQRFRPSGSDSEVDNNDPEPVILSESSTALSSPAAFPVKEGVGLANGAGRGCSLLESPPFLAAPAPGLDDQISWPQFEEKAAAFMVAMVCDVCPVALVLDEGKSEACAPVCEAISPQVPHVGITFRILTPTALTVTINKRACERSASRHRLADERYGVTWWG